MHTHCAPKDKPDPKFSMSERTDFKWSSNGGIFKTDRCQHFLRMFDIYGKQSSHFLIKKKYRKSKIWLIEAWIVEHPLQTISEISKIFHLMLILLHQSGMNCYWQARCYNNKEIMWERGKSTESVMCHLGGKIEAVFSLRWHIAW